MLYINKIAENSLITIYKTNQTLDIISKFK